MPASIPDSSSSIDAWLYAQGELKLELEERDP